MSFSQREISDFLPRRCPRQLGCHAYVCVFGFSVMGKCPGQSPNGCSVRYQTHREKCVGNHSMEIKKEEVTHSASQVRTNEKTSVSAGSLSQVGTGYTSCVAEDALKLLIFLPLLPEH
ncbi:hypothetical protein H671_1g1730 [Cricetulus griseus]|nr:hypothetical protein H671_1g1730 [Cricetulus griseus]